jgi:hypothetical protein
MIKPVELEAGDGGRETWDTIVAASEGDVVTLRRLLERSPRLVHAGYWYTPAVHFAVREGHADAVQLLLDAGADPESNGLNDRTLIEMAGSVVSSRSRRCSSARATGTDGSPRRRPITRFTSRPNATTSRPSARCLMPIPAS